MFTRIVLITIAVISLGWISYMSYDMINSENEYNPTFLFSKLDDQILIVNSSSDLRSLLDHCPTTEENNELINRLNTSIDFKLILSSKRNHVLLTSEGLITSDFLKELFNDDPSLKNTGFNSFKIEGYSGTYHRNNCYIFAEEFKKSTPTYSNFQFDENATASIIHFEKGNYDATDIYIKNGNSIEFKRKIDGTKFGKKVNDAQLFGSILSSRIESYEFFETDYLRATDKIFNKSPMNSWVKTGLVKVILEGKLAVVSDYREGQNPINVMCEALAIEPQNYESATFKATSLLNDFGNNGQLYFYLMDDYVVISNDKSTCEKIVADYKLGNTLIHNESKRDEFYSNLPQKVNYRFVQKNEHQSISVDKNYLLATKLISEGSVKSTNNETEKLTSINVNETISDFFQLDENQQFVVSKNNKLLFFQDGIKKWEKNMNSGKQIGSAQLIDIYGNNKLQLLIATEKKLDLIDANGNNVPGFPIELKDNSCQKSPAFYRWKNQSYVLVPIENGQLIQFSSEGKKLATIKTKITTLDLQPVVWASSNKPFVGLYGESKFEMIQLESKKSFRTFDAPECTHFLSLPNEIILLGSQNGNLFQINQKGEKSEFGRDIQGKILGVNNNNKVQTVLVKQQNKIVLLNSKGESWATIPNDFQDIEYIALNESENGRIVLTIINGLENNVSLYSFNGTNWKTNTYEGSTKAGLTYIKTNRYTLTTVVDKILVHYEEK